MKTINAQKIVDILNEILEKSPETIYFYLQKVKPNLPTVDKVWVEKHPSLIPFLQSSGDYSLSLLGIFNGILNDSLTDMERIAYYEDLETGEIQKFEIIVLDS